jgi:hypothetical protein
MLHWDGKQNVLMYGNYNVVVFRIQGVSVSNLGPDGGYNEIRFLVVFLNRSWLILRELTN